LRQARRGGRGCDVLSGQPLVCVHGGAAPEQRLLRPPDRLDACPRCAPLLDVVRARREALGPVFAERIVGRGAGLDRRRARRASSGARVTPSAWDLRLAARAFSVASVAALVALLVIVTTDHGASWARRAAMWGAIAPIAGAVGVVAALRVASARGEL